MLKWFRRVLKSEPAPEAPIEDLASARARGLGPDAVEAADPTPLAPESLAPEEPVGPAELAEPPARSQAEAPDEPVFEDAMDAAALETTVRIELNEPLAEDELIDEDEEPASPEADPETQAKGFFARLRERLTKTSTALVDKVRVALSLHGKADEELFEEIEMILLQSDVGVPTTQKIVERMRQESRRLGATDADALLALFKRAIAEILAGENRKLDLTAHHPEIIVMVGVNGTGKTTTIGKLARQLSRQGKRVLMVAADTFRAAAIEQLTIWAQRTGSGIARQDQGADPAAVVFEALQGSRAEPPDVILIDTAGRLHTKLNLMEELKKIVRVIKRHYPDAPHETILVLDATTGQNAVQQVKLFHEACQLTGLIMTKLDGTAKGGILIACKDLYRLPVFKIGIGEGIDDLRDFEPDDFVEALFSEKG